MKNTDLQVYLKQTVFFLDFSCWTIVWISIQYFFNLKKKEKLY